MITPVMHDTEEYWVGLAGPFSGRAEAEQYAAVLSSPEPVYVVCATCKEFLSY